MKKKLFLMLTVVLSVSLFTACSSDDDDHEVVGKWNLSATPIHAEWKSNNAEMEAGIQAILEETLPVLSEGLKSVLKSITLGADGSIVAEYRGLENSNPNFQTSPKGLATYSVKGDKLFVVLDLEKIMAATSRAEMTSPILDMLENGIPVNYKVTGNEILFYIDKALVTTVYNDPIVQALIAEQIEELDPQEQAEALFVLEQIEAVMQATTKLELGIKLQK